MGKGNIWVVDDDESIRWVLERGLSENGIQVETFDSANKVIKKLETEFSATLPFRSNIRGSAFWLATSNSAKI